MRCPLTKCELGCKCGANLLFVLFVILGLAIWLLHLNQPLFYMINAYHVYLPDRVLSLIAFIAYPKFFILPALLLLLTAIFRRDQFTNVLILIAVYYIVFFVLKRAFGAARPYTVLPAGSFFLLGGGYENLVKTAYHSFPSGHAGNAALFAFAAMRLFFARHPIIKFILFLIPVVVAVDRICAGHHWPLDVLAGILISYILVKLFLKENAQI